jgi:hypothetical protein
VVSKPKENIMGHKKKKRLYRWLGLRNIPTFDQYMFKLPNFSFYLQKNVNICEVDVLGLGFRVNSRLGGYIF